MDDDEAGEDVEPAESEGQREVRGLIAGLVVALLGAEVGLAMPGPGGAALGAATGSLPLAWEVVQRRIRGRVRRAVEDGVAGAEMTPEAFAAWVAEDARHGALLVAVVETAARSTTERHLDALARVLADGIRAGVRDQARLDVITLVARALGDLGPAHLEVLHSLADELNTYRTYSTIAMQYGGEEAWAVDDLASRHRRLADGMDALVATLTARGCARARSGGYGGGSVPGYVVTSFGRACLAYLDERARRGDDG